MSSKHDHTTASGNASPGAPDRDALDSDSDAVRSKSRLGRRAFVKGIGATAAAGVGSKYLGSPIGGAQAVVPALLVGATIGAIAYGEIVAGPDGSAVADSLTWQSHVDEYTRAHQDSLNLDQTIASLERDIQLVANKAREEAIFRIYEQAVDSGTEADATAAAETAIDETYAVVEEAIIESFNLRSLRSKNVVQIFSDAGSLDSYLKSNDINSSNTGASYWGESGPFATSSTTLLDGRTITVQGSNHQSPDFSSNTVWNNPTTKPSNDRVYADLFVLKPDPADYSTADTTIDGPAEAELHNTQMWYTLLQDLQTEHSNVKGEVSAMVSNYYQPAVDGEIDLSTMLGPAHLTDTASTASDYQEAAMAMRAMGYPISKQVTTITVTDDAGNELDLTGRLAWTAHNGNTLPVGSRIVPSNYPGSIFAAVNLPDGVDSLSSDMNITNTTDTSDTTTAPGAETLELVDSFEISSAEGATEVSFEDRSLATADHNLTAAEIEQIFQDHYDANKEATETVHDTATGGGGGWSGMSTTEKAVAIGVAGLAVAGLLNN